jgi:hypothetical protein
MVRGENSGKIEAASVNEIDSAPRKDLAVAKPPKRPQREQFVTPDDACCPLRESVTGALFPAAS